jgi:3-oxoadipate CoA-transferase, alpha subunit
VCGGFGTAGMPYALIDALIRHGAKDLTVVNNNAVEREDGAGRTLRLQTDLASTALR